MVAPPWHGVAVFEQTATENMQRGILRMSAYANRLANIIISFFTRTKLVTFSNLLINLNGTKSGKLIMM